MLFSIKSAGAHMKKMKMATSTFIPCLGSSAPILLPGSCPNVIFSRVSTFYKTLRQKNQQDAGLAGGVYCSLWKLQCNRQLLRQKQLLKQAFLLSDIKALDSEKETGCYKHASDGGHQKGPKIQFINPQENWKY